ncbi:hypothetical protein cypCar_00048333 [Cyprinus carpio]|nr:hypothetical protein cypCar_00048333 [Cyprinus carpio]
MSSSRGVGLYLTLLLALLCDASEDGLQREMRLWPEELDFLMMQRPIIPDHSKIIAALDMTQREDTNFHPENAPIGRPVFSPLSVGPSMGSSPEWKKSLSAYCEIESGIKTVQYFCCMKRGKAKWSCFDKEASDSSYHISSEVSHGNTPKKIRGFKYNSSACKG